jgi:hypothetical protein
MASKSRTKKLPSLVDYVYNKFMPFNSVDVAHITFVAAVANDGVVITFRREVAISSMSLVGGTGVVAVSGDNGNGTGVNGNPSFFSSAVIGSGSLTSIRRGFEISSTTVRTISLGLREPWRTRTLRLTGSQASTYEIDVTFI